MEESRELACNIVDLFDNLLNEKGMEIPCSDESEESKRHVDGNVAKLYGSEYWDLVNQIQSILDNFSNASQEISGT